MRAVGWGGGVCDCYAALQAGRGEWAGKVVLGGWGLIQVSGGSWVGCQQVYHRDVGLAGPWGVGGEGGGHWGPLGGGGWGSWGRGAVSVEGLCADGGGGGAHHSGWVGDDWVDGMSGCTG